MPSQQSTSFVLIPSNEGSAEPAPAAANPPPSSASANAPPLADDTPDPPAPPPPSSKYIVHLTNVAFYGSVVAIFFLIPSYILHVLELFTVSDRLTQAIVLLFIYSLVTLLISIFNRYFLRRHGRILLFPNLVVDFLLTLFLGAHLLHSILELTGGWRFPCWPRYGAPQYPSCHSYGIIIVVVVSFALASVGTVWISHMGMFVLRFREVLRLKEWKKPFPWFFNLPAGQILFGFEFSIKVVKGTGDEGGDRARGRSDVAGQSQSAGLGERTGNEAEVLVEV